MKIYYKVLRERLNKTLHSYCYSDGDELQYIKDKWIERRDGWGPLCVFDSLRAADDFVKKDNNHYFPTNIKIYMCCITESFDTNIWKKYKSGIQEWNWPLPKGTILADQVKIIEEVGGLLTTPKYWDCECKENYINPKYENFCNLCCTYSEDQQDSIVEEVIKASLPL
jgi:hypothetical protein